MPNYYPAQDSRYLFLQQWGLDTLITTICWSVACAALLQITMITPGPLLVVGGSVWCAVMFFRLKEAIRNPDSWQADFYRGHVALILLLLFAVGMATICMMCFFVGQNLLNYMTLPGAILLIGRALPGKWLSQVRLLIQSVAFAAACAIPAFYFSFTLKPLRMLTTGPVWYLGLLFFLMARERERLRTQATDSQGIILGTVTLILLLAATLVSSVTAPMFERTLCVTIAIGAGCLQGFCRLKTLVPTPVALALSWLSMALPAVLGIILYAPKSW